MIKMVVVVAVLEMLAWLPTRMLTFLVVVVVVMMSVMADQGEETTEVECKRCGYVWEYSGQMWKATCPRCSHKTPTGLKPDEFED